MLPAASLSFLDREPPLMLPEQHDPTFRMTERTSPENALYALSEADSLLPEGERGEIFSAAVYDMDRRFREQSGSLGNFLNVADSIPSDPLVDWLRQCGPAVVRMRDAVKQPYFLDPAPRMFGRGQWDGFRRDLPAASLGYAALLTHAPETTREGMDILLDCIRLSRMLWKEEGGDIGSRGIEEIAGQLLCHAMRRPHSAEHLAWLQTELEQLGPPFADRRALLEQFWRTMDDTVTWRPKDYRWQRRIAIMAAARDVVRHTRQWLPIREELYGMAAEPVVRYNAYFHNTPALSAVLNDDKSDLWWHIGFMREAAYQDQYYHRTMLMAALERFRRERGTYPANLGELSPAYMATLPADPFNFAPYLYNFDGARLLLYSPGENNTDEQGEGDDLTLLRLG